MAMSSKQMTIQKSFKAIIITLCCFLCFTLLSVSFSQKVMAQRDLFLPFLDDFSAYSGTPDTNLWNNSGAVVNNNYSFNAPTIGVVTLDILDINGKIYENASIYGFSADTLCSQSIRLDSIREPVLKRLMASDSVYLSFFIQPGGGMGNPWERLGSAPSSKDSIILQFYNSTADSWATVWSMRGTSLEKIYDSLSVYSLNVLIPITQEEYFNRDFRFRFINYGSLDNNPSYTYVSNKGQWNIDYVYLNINRSYQDSTIRDVAFVQTCKTFLKNFTAIPSKHFKEEYMIDTIFNTIVNLHSSTLNSHYFYTIRDENNSVLHSYNGGYENIVSYPQTHQFQDAKNHTRVALDYAFSLNDNNWKKFTITHVVSEGVGQDNIKTNDTSRFVQTFENYFAYDDGSAESGIGVEPANGSMFAVRYPLLKQDTLMAVDIYFNCSWQQSNLKPFYLYIYSATNDTLLLPDEELYASQKLTPVFDSLNKFSRFYLDEPLVLPQGEFFVVLKSANATYMNIGFDQNNDASPFTFEKKGNQWTNVFLRGSAMIRPYFGYRVVGMDNISEKTDIKFYPNPAKDYIYIDTPKQTDTKIMDINGRIVKHSYDKTINIDDLPNGLYILQINNQNKKLIITK